MKQRPGVQVSKRYQRGFNLIELLVAATVLAGIVAIVTSMMLAANKSQERLRVENVMRSETERALFGLANKLNQSRMVMGNDPNSPLANNVGLGNAYRTHLDLSKAPAPITPTYLPIIRSDGSLAPEKDCTVSPTNFFRSNTSGNALLFARYVGKFSSFSMMDNTATAAIDESITNKRNLDVYEFKYIYITDDPATTAAYSGSWYTNMWYVDRWSSAAPVLRRQRLMEWTSKRYIDYDQYSDYLTDLDTSDPTNKTTDRTNIRAALTAAGIQGVWRRSGTNYTASSGDIFYDIGSGGGNSVSASGASGYQIAMQSVQSLMHFDRDSYSVAYNTQPTKGTARYFPIRIKVPYFYDEAPPTCNGALPLPNTTRPQNTTASDSFPRGFEVMVIGPASGRSVNMRITTVAEVNKMLVDHADSTTAFARDL